MDTNVLFDCRLEPGCRVKSVAALDVDAPAVRRAATAAWPSRAAMCRGGCTPPRSLASMSAPAPQEGRDCGRVATCRGGRAAVVPRLKVSACNYDHTFILGRRHLSHLCLDEATDARECVHAAAASSVVELLVDALQRLLRRAVASALQGPLA